MTTSKAALLFMAVLVISPVRAQTIYEQVWWPPRRSDLPQETIPLGTPIRLAFQRDPGLPDDRWDDRLAEWARQRGFETAFGAETVVTILTRPNQAYAGQKPTYAVGDRGNAALDVAIGLIALAKGATTAGSSSLGEGIAGFLPRRLKGDELARPARVGVHGVASIVTVTQRGRVLAKFDVHSWESANEVDIKDIVARNLETAVAALVNESGKLDESR